MTGDTSDLHPFVAEQRRRPLGSVESASGQAMQAFSRAGDAAAANLLAKAAKALRGGDEDRARAYADRAARLPFDEHEEYFPGAMSATMALFTLMTDTLEETAEDDPTWLEAAAAAAAAGDEVSLTEMGETLRVIDKEYEITRGERARLRALTGELPVGGPLSDELGLGADELGSRILSVLRLCVAYREALG